jgi:hypothetical protein
MNERTIAALYDTRGAAESARDDLVAIGLSSNDVSIRSTEDESASDSSGGGFWATLGDMFMPDEDRYTYAEGMRRGGYLVSAQVPEGYEDRVADVLERHEPIDLDQRAESWRQGGWAGYDASTSGAYGSTAGAGAQTAYGGTSAGMAEAGAGYEHRERSVGTTGTDESIPVVEEQVRVGKREVGRGGVRVRSYVRERPVEEQVTLRDETVRVERRPVDRPIGAGDAVSRSAPLRPSSATRRR